MKSQHDENIVEMIRNNEELQMNHKASSLKWIHNDNNNKIMTNLIFTYTQNIYMITTYPCDDHDDVDDGQYIGLFIFNDDDYYYDYIFHWENNEK